MRMRHIGLVAGLCVTLYGWDAFAQGNVVRARAVLRDSVGNEIGTVLFTQAPADKNMPTPTVDVTARVEGLSPGLHGIHVHEVAACEPTFAAAGGHFDPGPNSNSSPDGNHPFHMGDLPNLEVNDAGVGHLRATTSRITLTDGPLSVFDFNGSSVIVHAAPDQGTTGVPGGAGGARIACGVIVVD